MVGKVRLLVVNKINDSLESELGRKRFTQARTPQAELVILSCDGSTNFTLERNSFRSEILSCVK